MTCWVIAEVLTNALAREKFIRWSRMQSATKPYCSRLHVNKNGGYEVSDRFKDYPIHAEAWTPIRQQSIAPTSCIWQFGFPLPSNQLVNKLLYVQ